MNRVVVTGLGCITPIGNTVDAFRDSLYAGRTGIAPFDLSIMPGALSPDPGIRFKTTAKVKDFQPTQNPEQHLSSSFILTSELGAQFGIIAARQAVAHSGLLQHYDARSIAIVTGCSCGGRARMKTRTATSTSATRASRRRRSSAPWPARVPATSPSKRESPARCSTSPPHAPRAPTPSGWPSRWCAPAWLPRPSPAATRPPLTYGFLRAWDSMRVVSPTSCRPFSVDRDGMTLGEGAAMLILEPLDAALARGARIYAEIVGFGMSADAHHITQPRAEGAALAMRRALEDAAQSGIDSTPPAASATSTPTAPARPPTTLWKPPPSTRPSANSHPRIPVGATKSLTGHSIGAAGAIEALATVLALDAASLPHTAGVTEVDPTLNLDILIDEPRPLAADKDLALSNSLAFGGLNAVLAFRRYQ